jgi:hypothetical protein
VATTSGDLDFCTFDCDIGRDGQCGDGARCAGQGAEPAKCVPAACFDALDRAPIYAQVKVPCTLPAAVNDFGVGKPCTTMEDCQGQHGAVTCPDNLHPDAGLPNWCSFLCDDDSACGPNAFCWRRPSTVEDGGAVVGSCAPIACRIDGD